MSMSKDEQLMWEAQGGEFEIVKQLCADPDVKVNWQNGDGFFALFVACQEGRVPIIQHLLAHPEIDPNCARKGGATSFFVACVKEHPSVVLMLLADERIDVNKPLNTGATPFFAACVKEHSSVVLMLLADQRVDVNQPDNDGVTPFFAACQQGLSSVVSMLLVEQRIDVNRTQNINCTPLWIASCFGYLSVVQVMLASGREIDTKIRSSAFSNRTAAEQGRSQPNVPGENESEEEFQRRITNGPIIADLIDSYENKPLQVRSELRRLPALRAQFIGYIYSLIVLSADSYFTLASTAPAEVRRFFGISSRLPLELQMLLSNRTHGSGEDIVRKVDSENGFKWAFQN